MNIVLSQEEVEEILLSHVLGVVHDNADFNHVDIDAGYGAIRKVTISYVEPIAEVPSDLSPLPALMEAA